MKILHIISSYWPAFRFGGPIQSVHMLNKALVEEGVDVFVYTTNAGLKNNNKYSQKGLELEGVKVFYFPYVGSENFNYSPELKKAIKKNIKNFDLIHITGVWNYPIFISAYFAKKFNKPYIVSPRGTLYKETFLGGSTLSKLKKKIYWPFIGKKIIESSRALHFTTIDEAEKTISFLNLKNNYFILPNGLDFKAFLKDKPSSGYFKNKFLKGYDYILALGRLNWKKGFDILLPAFTEVAKNFPNIKLVIAGPDERNYKNTIEKIIKKNNLKGKIIFTGLLKGKDKLGAYLDAKIFVLPSYSENFGMSVVEAMALGKPVIVSNKVGLHKEIEKAQAGLIAKTEPKSVSWAMINILKNSELARQLSENAVNFSQKEYNIKEIGKNMKREYEKLIKK